MTQRVSSNARERQYFTRDGFVLRAVTEVYTPLSLASVLVQQMCFGSTTATAYFSHALSQQVPIDSSKGGTRTARFAKASSHRRLRSPTT